MSETEAYPGFTTVYIRDEDFIRLMQLKESEGHTIAVILSEAIKRYALARHPHAATRFTGAKL